MPDRPPVGSWSPVIPVEVVPSDAGGDTLTRQAFGYDVDGNVVRKDAFWSGLTGSTSVKRAVRNDGRELW